MNRNLPLWAGALCCLGGLAAHAAGQSVADPIETIHVYGERPTEFGTALITDDRVQHGSADVARLLARLPGAEVNENGSITGQIQYRGMFGPRLDVRVNGMRIAPGGPNWIDPPMHYMPPGLPHSATLERGIADVSHGGIGGAASASWKRPDYAPGDAWQPYVDLDSTVRSVDDGSALAATVGVATHRQRFYLAGSDESAEDAAGAGHRRAAVAAVCRPGPA